jgi:hypothetical protein
MKKTRANRWTSKRHGVRPGVVKVKIGTILEDDVVQKLKEMAVRERRPISEIIQEAVVSHMQTGGSRKKELRLAAFKRFCSASFNLSRKDWEEIMDEDYYEQ